jgi:3D (Asp-Asp-Asp) domain-containing protein
VGCAVAARSGVERSVVTADGDGLLSRNAAALGPRSFGGAMRRRLLAGLVGSILMLCGSELFAAQIGSPEPFVVTAYCRKGITKSGIPAAPGVAAADPHFVPLGSVVGVSDPYSTDLSIYSVADTGSKVKGLHLDLFTPDCGRAKRFGRRLLQVTILRLGRRAHR